MTIGAQEFKEIVWKAMADSIAEKITYEEFRARIVSLPIFAKWRRIKACHIMACALEEEL